MLTKKDLLEAIKDMPMDATIIVHTYEGWENVQLEGYFEDSCLEHKGNVIVLCVC